MQLQQNKKQEDLSKIDSLLHGGKSVGIDGNIFELAINLHCLGDIIGREYDVEYDINGRISKFCQKPMRIDKILALIRESNKYSVRQEKQSKEVKERKMLGRKG